MAAGVPVIACGDGAIPEVVTHGVNGVLISRDHAHAEPWLYLNTVRELREDTELRQAVIGGGIAAVRQRFSWDVVLPQYQALFDI
jgi:glycosyltransferase involved in cell wall biosynthesis